MRSFGRSGNTNQNQPRPGGLKIFDPNRLDAVVPSSNRWSHRRRSKVPSIRIDRMVWSDPRTDGRIALGSKPMDLILQSKHRSGNSIGWSPNLWLFRMVDRSHPPNQWCIGGAIRGWVEPPTSAHIIYLPFSVVGEERLEFFTDRGFESVRVRIRDVPTKSKNLLATMRGRMIHNRNG